MCTSNTSVADAPPPCEDSGASEEEQHNVWNHFTGTRHVPGQQPKDTAMPQQEEELCKTALTCHFALDVICMSMEW